MIGGIPGLGPAFLSRSATGSTGEAAPASTGTTGASSFAEALAGLADKTVGTLQKAEGASLDALQGRGDTRAVVDAVMSAEQSLQAAVAIRDKIVMAYLDVSRMAI